MPRRLVNTLPALLVPTALVWVAGSRGVFPAPAATVITIVVLAALMVGELDRGVVLSGASLWLGVLVAWGGVDSLLRPVESSEAARFVAVGAVAVALAVLATRPRVAAWGRAAVVVAGCTGAVWLLGERLAGSGRPAGPFENPNVAATVIVLALALVVGLRCRAAPRLGLAALLVVGAVASSSRAAMLAVLAIGLGWALLSVQRWLRLAVLGLVAVAAIGLAARLANDRDPLRFERVRIWLVAVRTAVAELPLGAGPAGYADAALRHNFPLSGGFARYHRQPSLAESDALQAAASLGIPGIVLAAGLVLAAGRACARRRDTLLAFIAIAVTSAFHTQLPLPVVAWSAALATACVPDRPRRRLRVPPGLALAGVAVAAPALAYALQAAPSRPASAAELVASGDAALAQAPRSDADFADAEALVSHACELRPRWSYAWSRLGSLRLERAMLRGEPNLAAEAADAFAAARAANPLDAWGALGEGRARRLLGDGAAAAGALQAAIRLEPNCAPAWMELALLRGDEGQITAARRALAGAEAALAAARGETLESDYERAMARVDATALARLRLRYGGAR